MSTHSAQLKARREQDWRRLRYLTDTAQAGVARLSEEELWELPGLYRKTLSDLSLLRTSGDNPQLIQELSHLCNRAHAIIYRRTAKRKRNSFLRLIAVDLPRTFRRRKGYIIAASVVTACFALIGYLHGVLQPELTYTVMDTLQPGFVQEWQSSLEHAQEISELRLAAQIPEEQRSLAAFQITTNNIMVSFRAFIGGLIGGFPTLLLLAFNGYLLGVVGFLYIHTPSAVGVSLPLYFISGIAPHGSIELPAICVAGAAGMLLGFSWIFPGQRTRGEALRAAARDAWHLVLIVIITLLIAGAIEGFITPLYPFAGMSWETLFWLKIVFGTLMFVLWLGWLTRAGRPKHNDSQQAAMPFAEQ